MTAKPYDPTLKALVETEPASWPVLFGQAKAPTTVLDADIATVSGAADNVLLERVRPGHDESHRLLCAHYLHKRSIKKLAEESGQRACAVDSRVRRHVKRLLAAAAGDPSGTDMRERFRATMRGRKKLKEI